MQEPHKPGFQVGDHVVIDWPRTLWDHRRGRVQEYRLERGHRPQACVILDALAVLLPIDRRRRA